MTSKSCVETFNGLIPQMREGGHTLQAIGDVCGVTRERIRQILEEHYPNTAPLFFREGAAERLLGFTAGRLSHLRGRGLINPKRRGKHWLYNKAELEKAMLAYYHPCLMCGEITKRPKYCEKCGVERRRNYYPFLTPEQKREHNNLVRHWMREHPERIAEIQRKAIRAYLGRERKKHFRETIYVVFRHCALPVGTKFKAIGYRKPHLLLISGIKIPIGCVRKTNAGRIN